jgi:predicted short-subunit dehydrogenase-like oxidoreductase (DUF2520 family)
MEKKIERIVLIGAGNVATHLAKALSKKSEIVGVFSRNGITSNELALKIGSKQLEKIQDIPSCDLVLICVNDASIPEILQQIPSHFNIAYTSGSTELDPLSKHENVGVFYPLQTFSKDNELEINSIPFFIEASNPEFESKLMELASTISEKVSLASSEERKKLHLAAIFVNNFSNHLATIAKDYLENQNLNWEHLKPLISETTNKIINSSPKDSQTGPARRNDALIINEHIKMLSGYPKEIYALLSKSISETYSQKNDK